MSTLLSAFVRAKYCFIAENQVIWIFVTVGYLVYAISDSILAIGEAFFAAYSDVRF